MTAGVASVASVASVAIRGLAGVEHLQLDGSFRAYLPEEPVPPPIKPGDRLRIHLAVADDAWIYAVAVIRKTDYWKLGAWPPVRGDGGDSGGGGVRMLWPGGHRLTTDEATMTTLLVIASRHELPWLRDLRRTDCAMLVGKPPADPPATVCDQLYGLFHKIPKRVRGIVMPVVDWLTDGATVIPAIVAEHRGAPYTAIDWQFKPRS